MAKGFKHGAGGVSALNFKVVGGTSQPGNPKENTIWVNTSVAITGWVFSATEPESPVEGMVWILNGASSVVWFNALKKNEVRIYPIGAKQYVSGAWVNKTAKTYQSSKWVEWTRYLLNTMPLIEWQPRAWRYSDQSYLGGLPIVTQANEGVRIVVPASTTGVYETVGDIDLTGLSKIYLEVVNENDIECVFSVGDRNGTYSMTSAKANIKIRNSDGTFVLDVGLITGMQCVYLALPRPQTILVKRIWVE